MVPPPYNEHAKMYVKGCILNPYQKHQISFQEVIELLEKAEEEIVLSEDYNRVMGLTHDPLDLKKRRKKT